MFKMLFSTYVNKYIHKYVNMISTWRLYNASNLRF
jgi:hypothetical protein